MPESIASIRQKLQRRRARSTCSIAAKQLIETGRNFCLVLSRVRCVYSYPSGCSCESHYVPGMSMGRGNAGMALSKRASRAPLSKKKRQDHE